MTTPKDLTRTTLAADAMVAGEIARYRAQPRWAALRRILGEEIDHVESLALAVRDAFDPTTAVGVQLDFCGRLLNLPRRGLSDAAYRVAIVAEQTVLRSAGTLPDLLLVVSAVQAALGSTWDVQLSQAEERCVNVHVTADTSDTGAADKLGRLLRALRRAAGNVELVLRFGTAARADRTLRWASARRDDPLGWASVADGGATLGGLMLSVLRHADGTHAITGAGLPRVRLFVPVRPVVAGDVVTVTAIVTEPAALVAIVAGGADYMTDTGDGKVWTYTTDALDDPGPVELSAVALVDGVPVESAVLVVDVEAAPNPVTCAITDPGTLTVGVEATLTVATTGTLDGDPVLSVDGSPVAVTDEGDGVYTYTFTPDATAWPSVTLDAVATPTGGGDTVAAEQVVADVQAAASYLLDLDANDLALADGANVTTWGGLTASGTAPTFDADSFGPGRDGVAAGGAGVLLDAAWAEDMSGPWSIHIAADIPTPVADSGRAFALGTFSAVTRELQIQVLSSGQLRLIYSVNGANVALATLAYQGIVDVALYHDGAGNVAFDVDTASDAIACGTVDPSPGIGIAGRPTGGQPCAMTIAGARIAQGELAADTRALVREEMHALLYDREALYDVDFTALPTQILASDGSHTIDGKTWWIVNRPTGRCGVVNGEGLVLGGGGSTGNNRTVPALSMPLAQIVGAITPGTTSFEVWFDFDLDSSPTAWANYQFLAMGIAGVISATPSAGNPLPKPPMWQIYNGTPADALVEDVEVSGSTTVATGVEIAATRRVLMVEHRAGYAYAWAGANDRSKWGARHALASYGSRQLVSNPHFQDLAVSNPEGLGAMIWFGDTSVAKPREVRVRRMRVVGVSPR